MVDGLDFTFKDVPRHLHRDAAHLAAQFVAGPNHFRGDLPLSVLDNVLCLASGLGNDGVPLLAALPLAVLDEALAFSASVEQFLLAFSADFFISANGRDAWSGRRAQPVVTLQDEDPRKFDAIPCRKGFDVFEWMGFASMSKERVVYYVDNFTLRPVE